MAAQCNVNWEPKSENQILCMDHQSYTVASGDPDNSMKRDFALPLIQSTEFSYTLVMVSIKRQFLS